MMQYSINNLAKLSGVSTRALRYYDQIDLLRPTREAANGYRVYGKDDVDRLQQILFYREIGVPLREIKLLLATPDFDRYAALQTHLERLTQKRKRMDALILTVQKTMQAMKGDTDIMDYEKFEGFKQNLINENEAKYGSEIRKKYGNAAVDAANAHVKGMEKEQYERAERLLLEFEKTLAAAFETGDAAGELAQRACELHRQWLCVFYDQYSKAYHKGLGEMYVADDRFRANYDKIAPNCTEFLRDAIHIFCAEEEERT